MYLVIIYIERLIDMCFGSYVEECRDDIPRIGIQVEPSIKFFLPPVTLVPKVKKKPLRYRVIMII